MLKSFLEIQALDNPFCCLHTGNRTLLYPQWRIQGRGPGASPAPPPPLILDQLKARRAEKIVFWRPPSPLSQGLDPALTLLDFGVIMKDSA